MKITALSKRRHRLTAVYFGDVCETVDTETLLLSGLREGSEVSEEEWQSLKETAEQNRAYEKALYLLEYRAHQKRAFHKAAHGLFRRGLRTRSLPY